MSVLVDTTGAESIMVLEIYWGNGVTAKKYADKFFVATPITISGRILQMNVVSKTAQIGQLGVSQTVSVTLDDTDDALKTIYDSKYMEGSRCIITQRIVNEASTVDQHIMTGRITSDITWSEGERTLSFSIAGGTNKTGASTVIGYAPASGEVANLNSNAIGNNWPVVFGTAHKVPAARIIYTDNITLVDSYGYTHSTYEFENGDQLPQAPTVITVDINGLLFEGTITDTTFTPTIKNKPRYTTQEFGPRISSDVDDYTNPCVAWVPSGVSLTKMYVWVQLDTYRNQVNYCVRQDGNKCYFAQPWFDTFNLDETHEIAEAAKWPRISWPVDMVYNYDGGSLAAIMGKDQWTIYKGDRVNYESGADYDDRYVANLYPSTSILAIYGKRAWKGKTIWAKIPQSYYHYHLSQDIVTGTVTRHCTVIDFPKQLSQYECEGWTDEIWVTLVSTLAYYPKDIVEWAIGELTTLTFDDANSDDPPVTMDFAYFETTDALEFLSGIAYQSASALQILDDTVRLVFLAQVPGTTSSNVLHVLPDSGIIMKSVELGLKATEEINTIHRSTYVTDYSGEKSASHVYEIQQNISTLGVQKVTDDMWALTCSLGVKAITDFWGVKAGNSWKTVKCDCFLDFSDANVFDGVQFQIAPFLPTDTKGLLTGVVHDTDRPCVSITVEMAIKAGSCAEDAGYWTLGVAECVVPSDTEEDYTPEPDPSCPTTNGVGQITAVTKKWHIAIVYRSARLRRNSPFWCDLEIHDHEHKLVAENVGPCHLKVYSDNPGDCWYETDFSFIAGVVELHFLPIRRSMLGVSRLHLWINPNYSRINAGNVRYEKPS